MPKVLVPQDVVDRVVEVIKTHATGHPKKGKWLRSFTPFSDRDWRAAVAQARKSGIPICAGNDGFWYADSVEDITIQINRATSYRDELDAVVTALARTRLLWELDFFPEKGA